MDRKWTDSTRRKSVKVGYFIKSFIYSFIFIHSSYFTAAIDLTATCHVWNANAKCGIIVLSSKTKISNQTFVISVGCY